LDELGVGVPLGVVLDENRCGFFISVLGDEETGRLGKEAGLTISTNIKISLNEGTYKTVPTWSREGIICNREGSRQDQLLLVSVVPMAMAEARI
jgi:hypothetical protein